jgi:antitoxin MazE
MEASMLRKIFRTGNSVVVSLPKEVLDSLELQEGTQVEIDLDRENRQMTLRPVEKPLAILGVDEKFAAQVADFIEKYRPALEELAK